MPKAFSKEFREDVNRVYRDADAAPAHGEMTSASRRHAASAGSPSMTASPLPPRLGQTRSRRPGVFRRTRLKGALKSRNQG